MCWLPINSVVSKDTKVAWQLHGKAPPQGRGFRRYGGRWWGGDDVFLVVLHRAFTMAWLVGWACELGQAGACCWSPFPLPCRSRHQPWLQKIQLFIRARLAAQHFKDLCGWPCTEGLISQFARFEEMPRRPKQPLGKFRGHHQKTAAGSWFAVEPCWANG